MLVTPDQLRKYITTFHHALGSIGFRFLPAEHIPKLLHRALLPAKVTAFISTRFGVAFQYAPAGETSVTVECGPEWVEDMLLRPPKHIRSLRDVRVGVAIEARDITLGELTVRNAYPFRVCTVEASVVLAGVTFEVGNWKRSIGYVEVYGDNSAERWTVAAAESRAKDEILVAMLDVQKAKQREVSIDEYIADYKSKHVLLLGDYSEPGMVRLDALSSALSDAGYVPVMIKDFSDHPHQSLPQKVLLFGSASRFVVIDDSSRSGHLYEVGICQNAGWVTVLLRADGKGGSYMTAGASTLSNVIAEIPYDPNMPAVAIAEAVDWVEKKLKDLERVGKKTYPWRADPR